MIKKQQGAALVVVLVLLAISLMIGLSGVQSSLMGERMAGNYRAHALAYNEAEAGILHAAEAIAGGANMDDLFLLPGGVNPPLGSYKVDSIALDSGNSRSFLLTSDGYYGYDGPEGRQARRQVTGLFTVPGTGPVGLMACENLALRGGGLIDSYDSSSGPYGENGNELRSNVTIGTQLQDAQTTIAGKSTVYGQVLATGAVTMESSAIIGNIKANDDLTISGSKQVEGKPEGVIFGNVGVGGDATLSSTTHGNVRAAQNVHFNNHSEVKGDAIAETFSGVDPPPVSGTAQEVAGGPEVTAVDSVASAAECDDFNVPVYREKFSGIGSSCPNADDCHLNESGVNLQMGREGIYTDDPNNPLYEAQSMTIDGREVHVVRLDSFSLSGQSSFTVGATGNPVNMVLVVDGNTTIENKGEFRISPESTLQVVTNGKFKATSDVTLATDKQPSVEVDGEIWPTLSLFSTYEDGNERQTGSWEPGVSIAGKSDFYGLVSAPFSMVSLSSKEGNIYGAVNAREIDFSGHAGFHYDERLGEMDYLEGDGTEPSVPRLVHLYETFTH